MVVRSADRVARGGLGLTAQQAAVVDHVLSLQVTVVGAGAGSGKTRTIVATTLELVDQGRADLAQFVLITFTNKAADELRERLEAAVRARLIGAQTAAERDCWRRQQESLAAAFVGTIHSFCRRLLRLYGYDELVARDSDVSFAVSSQHEAAFDAVEESLGTAKVDLLGSDVDWDEHELRKLVEGILDYCRSRGIDVEQVLRQTRAQPVDQGKPYRLAVANLVARTAELYQGRKQERQALDANDLLLRTADLLRGTNGPHVVARLAARYRYLFVDEFQDTDRVQKQIVDALKGGLSAVLVVGDRKQSIYGFRAADVSLIEEIARENGVAVMPLSISRRPTKPLLDVQNALFRSISHLYPALGEPLDPWDGILESSGGPAPLTYVSAGVGSKIEDRIELTAKHIKKYLGAKIEEVGPDGERRSRQIEFGDVALLTRTNRHLRSYRLGLAVHGLDVREDAGGQLYACPEVVATYRMLSLILQYPDDAALSLALGTPYLRGVDAASAERSILQPGPNGGAPLTAWFEKASAEQAGQLEALRTAIRTDTVPQLLARLYESFGILAYYRGLADEQAAANLERLREIARALFGTEQALTLRQFVGWLKQAILTGQEEAEAELGADDKAERPPYIRALTIHRAKGLEFPIVVIPELQSPVVHEDLEPEFLVIRHWGLEVRVPVDGVETRTDRFDQELRRSRQAQLEEEMRILYVAVTRAQHAVLLVGGGRDQASLRDDPYYAWKDEVLRARPQLLRLGARFHP